MVQPDLSHLQDNREPCESSNGDSPANARQRLTLAEQETRRLAKSHYENFLVASVLLPRRLRQPFYNVYAFCRQADDLADESPTPEIALAGLDAFQRELDETFAGRPGSNLFLALADTIEAFGLSQQPFDDLLDAFRQDQRVTRYQSFDQLLDYCRRSANPVGRIVLSLGGACREETAALSDQICTGLQLANFWQDVARDYAMGRIYLPLDEMDRFGVSEAMLAGQSTPPELKRLLADQCRQAEEFFQRGLPLAEIVPRWLAHDVKLFAHGGLATLASIGRIDYDVLRQRPTVSRWRQATLVVRAMLGLL